MGLRCPKVLLKLSSWTGLFKYTSDHLTVWAQTPMTSHHPQATIQNTYYDLTLSYFSDISLPHMPPWVFFVFAAPSIKNAFPLGHHKAHPHTSYKSLLGCHLLGKASLNTILSTSCFPYFFFLVIAFFTMDLNYLFGYLFIFCLLF